MILRSYSREMVPHSSQSKKANAFIISCSWFTCFCFQQNSIVTFTKSPWLNLPPWSTFFLSSSMLSSEGNSLADRISLPSCEVRMYPSASSSYTRNISSSLSSPSTQFIVQMLPKLALDDKQLDTLNRERFSRYSAEFVKAVELDPAREQALISFYCNQLITELKRKPIRMEPPQPLLTYKIIECAVQLFRRYYLHNRLEGSNPKQMAFVAAYLALKLEHVDSACIELFKERFLGSRIKDIVHFGQQNYSQVELQFLIGLSFDLDSATLIRPLESLLHKLRLELQDEPLLLAIQKESISVALNVLSSPNLFQLDFICCSLAVFVVALRRHFSMTVECLAEFGRVIEGTEFKCLCEMVARCDRKRAEARELVVKFQGWSSKDNSFRLPSKRSVSHWESEKRQNNL